MGAFEAKIAKSLQADRALRRSLKAIVEPLPSGLNKITKAELIAQLQRKRNAWETLTRRNQDLSDERLESESRQELLGHLKSYCSDEMQAVAAQWLIDVMQHMGTAR